MVFGENPYAEFQGDVANARILSPVTKRDLELLRRLQAAGIPVVAVFLVGPPAVGEPARSTRADAFVAAWLPGTEGGGIADVLFRKADGSIASRLHGQAVILVAGDACTEHRQ